MDWYPVKGTRVELVFTADEHTKLRPGDQGTVTRSDDVSETVHVDWDSGSTLTMLVCEGDVIRPAGHRVVIL